MPPWKPRSRLPDTSGKRVVVFDGALEWDSLEPPPGRIFYYRVTFHLSHPQLQRFKEMFPLPPLHWHPYQTEYFDVVQGKLDVQVAGKVNTLTAEDEELVCAPGLYHRLYPTPGGTEDLIFYLSATDAGIPFMIDNTFFENWYGYQNDILLHGEKLDLIQVINMFDAGDSYLAPPSWLPFGRFFSQWFGIVVGRWIGSMLGYRPFHREWTSDWNLAAEKLKSSVFLKRFAK